MRARAQGFLETRASFAPPGGHRVPARTGSEWVTPWESLLPPPNSFTLSSASVEALSSRGVARAGARRCTWERPRRSARAPRLAVLLRDTRGTASKDGASIQIRCVRTYVRLVGLFLPMKSAVLYDLSRVRRDRPRLPLDSSSPREQRLVMSIFTDRAILCPPKNIEIRNPTSSALQAPLPGMTRPSLTTTTRSANIIPVCHNRATSELARHKRAQFP